MATPINFEELIQSGYSGNEPIMTVTRNLLELRVQNAAGFSTKPPDNIIQLGDKMFAKIVHIDGNTLYVTDKVYIPE